LNTLRVKMHRQRLTLEACVEKCLARLNASNPSLSARGKDGSLW
jgi:hypothetical protein